MSIWHIFEYNSLHTITKRCESDLKQRGALNQDRWFLMIFSQYLEKSPLQKMSLALFWTESFFPKWHKKSKENSVNSKEERKTFQKPEKTASYIFIAKKSENLSQEIPSYLTYVRLFLSFLNRDTQFSSSLNFFSLFSSVLFTTHSYPFYEAASLKTVLTSIKESLV